MYIEFPGTDITMREKQREEGGGGKQNISRTCWGVWFPLGGIFQGKDSCIPGHWSVLIECCNQSTFFSDNLPYFYNSVYSWDTAPSDGDTVGLSDQI